MNKLFGVQRSAANEAAVNVRLGQKVFGVLVIHGAAVENGGCPGCFCRGKLPYYGADVLAEVPEDILRYVQEQNK